MSFLRYAFILMFVVIFKYKYYAFLTVSLVTLSNALLSHISLLIIPFISLIESFIRLCKILIPCASRNLRKHIRNCKSFSSGHKLPNWQTLYYNQYRNSSQMSIAEKASIPQESMNGLKEDCVTEIEIPVPWGHINGKWWGPLDRQPIVAIHGWQDNAGTFDTLVPLLPSNLPILAIDLPGHGLSSHYPVGQFYYIFWDGIVTLRRVINYYKWNKVKLLGHSLGGAISFLYAASYPDEVEFMISLDIAGPSVRDITKSPAQTGDIIDKFLKYESMQPDSIPSYTYEEVLNIVEDAYGGSITKEGAIALMKRGLKPSSEPDKFYFSRDPRLKVSGMGMLSLDLVLAYAGRIKCNYLNIRAVPGMKLDHPESYEKILEQIKCNSRKFEYHKVEGTHHVHLNNPEKLAPIINNFIST